MGGEEIGDLQVPVGTKPATDAGKFLDKCIPVFRRSADNRLRKNREYRSQEKDKKYAEFFHMACIEF
jgi:hypothetical protein